MALELGPGPRHTYTSVLLADLGGGLGGLPGERDQGLAVALPSDAVDRVMAQREQNGA